MTNFEQQVAEALDNIPHADDCGVIPGYPGIVHECTCDRDERTAQQVAAAIEAASHASGLAEHNGLYGERYKAEVQAAALAALVSPPPDSAMPLRVSFSGGPFDAMVGTMTKPAPDSIPLRGPAYAAAMQEALRLHHHILGEPINERFVWMEGGYHRRQGQT